MKISFDEKALKEFANEVARRKIKVSIYSDRVSHLLPWVSLATDNITSLSVGEQETFLKSLLLCAETAKAICKRRGLNIEEGN